MHDYLTAIGLEFHAELKTRTKIFCSCPTESGAAPNTHVCPICLGLPGVLPSLNRRVVELAVKAGLALNCRISEYSKFDRKIYFYPDLPKGYQVTQYPLPICRDGHVTVKDAQGQDKRVRINRIHMEEDAGKLDIAATTWPAPPIPCPTTTGPPYPWWKSSPSRTSAQPRRPGILARLCV